MHNQILWANQTIKKLSIEGGNNVSFFEIRHLEQVNKSNKGEEKKK